MSKSQINEDIEMIMQQTGIKDKNKAETIYNNNDKDVIKAISFFYDPNYVEEEKKEKKLTESQQKIKELREIADFRDAYLEKMLEAKRAAEKLNTSQTKQL